jgi:hypothetical protein
MSHIGFRCSTGIRSRSIERPGSPERSAFPKRWSVSRAAFNREFCGERLPHNGAKVDWPPVSCSPVPLASPRVWTENDIDPSRLAEFSALLDRLYSLEADRDDEGTRRPYVVGMTGEARRVWIAYYQEHNATLATLNNDLAAAWSKLEEYAARLVLICHLARWASGAAPSIDPLVVDVESMRAGVTLANWFKNETQRIYAILEESDGERDRRELSSGLRGEGDASRLANSNKVDGLSRTRSKQKGPWLIWWNRGWADGSRANRAPRAAALLAFSSCVNRLPSTKPPKPAWKLKVS